MDLELRPITDDEWPAFHRAISTGFGNVPGTDTPDPPPISRVIETERTVAVFDDDEVVGTAGAYSFSLTVPGGAQVRVAGVTMVTVRATHRRRGLLVAMMDHQLDDVAARGEPIAVLTASESLIYERFGYGSATTRTAWELETDHSAFLTPPDVAGRLRLLDLATAAPLVGRVYDDSARSRVGEVTRSATYWEQAYDPARTDQFPSGDPKFFTVVHEGDDGVVDGFARYALDQAWTDGIPAYRLRVLEMQSPRPDVEAALWRYLLDVDLVKTVSANDRPLEEPLRWRLVDPRQLRVTTAVDHLWVRIVDVGAAMASRTYTVDDALVIGLHDAFRPVNDGAWLVEGGPEGAQCARTDRDPDVVLSAPDLGALFLGGVDTTTLAHAGRVEERTSGAVSRADRFFRHHPSPWCTTHF